MVDKLTKVAHRIIDLVEEKIRHEHSDIDEKAKKLEGNTLLQGEGYYDLENEVVQVLKDNFNGRFDTDFQKRVQQSRKL